MVVHGSRPEHDRPVVQIVLQRGCQLPSDIGGVLWISHTLGGTVKAADAAVPPVGDLAALEKIRPIESLGAVGDAKRPFTLVLAGPEDEVGGRAHLA